MRPVSIEIETDRSKSQTAITGISIECVGALSHLTCVPSVGHLVITAKSPFNFDFWMEILKTHRQHICSNHPRCHTIWCKSWLWWPIYVLRVC